MSNPILDVVSAEDLARFDELTVARRGLADSLLGLKLEEIQILAAAKRVNDEYNNLLKKIASERGIDPNAHFEIDPRTGRIVVNANLVEEPPAPEPEPAEPE